MSSSSPDMIQECPRCSAALAPGALECGSCHALIKGAELEQLAASARWHEERREYLEARDAWLKALELLPPDSAQAEWVRGNTKRLDASAANAPAVDARLGWAKKLGPFAPVAILVIKGKTLLALFKLKFLLSLGAFVAFYWALYGVKFGVGFAILILVHEMGHFIDIKRRGLPADMPMFLPGLGAYVKWNALGVSQEIRSAISLAGPGAGSLAAGLCTLLWFQTHYGLWASLARTGAWFNASNLIPLWIFDGNS